MSNPADPKKCFVGTIHELMEKLIKDIRTWSKEEKAACRRDIMRHMSGGKTMDGKEWIN